MRLNSAGFAIGDGRIRGRAKRPDGTGVQFDIPTSVREFLRQDAIFQRIQFRCRRFAYVRDIAELKDNIPFSINALVKILDSPRNSLRLAFGYGLQPTGNRRKHIVLDRDSEQQIPDWIRQNTERSAPVTRQEAKHYSMSQFQTAITRGWAKLFVLRCPDQIIDKKSSASKHHKHFPIDQSAV
jgi:hypothetical protein